jgi:hypothetical protein
MMLVLCGVAYHGHERFISGICAVLGMGFSVTLLAWSLWSFRRNPRRAVVGLAVCLVIVFVVLVIPHLV